MKIYPKILFLFIAYVLMEICSISAIAELIEPTRTTEDESKQKSKLTVFSEPPGFDVLLDGNGIGKTPIKLDEVEPGIHKLRIKDTETEIYIAPGKSFMLSFFKGSFLEIPQKGKEIEKQPKKEEEKDSGIEKSTGKKQDQIKYKPLYWPLNPRGPIY